VGPGPSRIQIEPVHLHVGKLEQAQQRLDVFSVRTEQEGSTVEGRKELEEALRRLARVEPLVHIDRDAGLDRQRLHRLLARKRRAREDARQRLTGQSLADGLRLTASTIAQRSQKGVSRPVSGRNGLSVADQENLQKGVSPGVS
jgi:hypothetical protein